ncbi:MAG TPA: hypothetical protein VGC65_00160 [Bacteroidia bacterium]|jgi:hypothetical protein
MQVGLKHLDIRELLGQLIESDGAGGWQLKTDGTLITGFATETTLLSVLAAVKKATGAAVTRVPASIASVQMLAANLDRASAIIVNESTSVLYLKYGAAATNIDYSLVLQENEIAIIDDYTGRIDGVWIAAVGNAQVTENT